ncbi:MAG: hypothetical protein HQ488_01750 [Parcubacteria group bacterium]|nr:hypothetical protein [Parcubacteria group bacterium]
MILRLFTFALVGFFVCTGFVQAEMTSTNYEIRWDTFSTGGSDTSSSSTYLLRDSVDGSGAARSSSSSYTLSHGYREGVNDQVITFDVQVQDRSDERSVSTLSGTTITTSVSGISVSDYVVLVQDKGAAQIAAVGKVISIGASSIVVDSLTNGGIAPTIDGSNDYLYQMDASAIALGTLSSSTFSTGIISMEVSATNDNGYVVQMFEDGDMRAGSNTITDVSDGAVTLGATEYGARSSDVSLASTTFDTVDSAITTTYQDVVTESSASFTSRNFITVKASIAAGAASGSYAQTLSFIASGNF